MNVDIRAKASLDLAHNRLHTHAHPKGTAMGSFCQTLDLSRILLSDQIRWHWLGQLKTCQRGF